MNVITLAQQTSKYQQQQQTSTKTRYKINLDELHSSAIRCMYTHITRNNAKQQHADDDDDHG